MPYPKPEPSFVTFLSSNSQYKTIGLFKGLKAYDFGYYSKVNSNEVAIVLNIDMGKQGLDVSGRANFMLRLQTQSRSLYTWLTGICGPIYNSNF